MEFVRFTDKKTKLSRICLGTMIFGDKCDESSSQFILHAALDLGINFIDTAAMYAGGVSEEYLGRALRGVRQDVFIATKFHAGLDRATVLASVDASLKRLNTDHVDLYLVHWPLPGMNITELMAALDEVVQSGKTRFVGCCNFPAWLLASCNGVAAEHGWSPLVSNQIAYNLIERGVEVEILPQATVEDIFITAYRPLAMGLLGGRFRQTTAMDQSARGTTDARVITWLSQHGDSIERFLRFSEEKGLHPAELAIAWLCHSPGVSCPIVGASSADQLRVAASGAGRTLSDEDYQEVTDLFSTEVKEEGLQLFPGLKYNFPRLRRKPFLARKE